MIRAIALRREAQQEFDEAFDWYEGRRPGLGRQFAERIQEVLDRIAANPEMHAVVYKNARNAIVRRFPYSVFYQIEPKEIIVLAIFHGKRNPRIWQDRVK